MEVIPLSKKNFAVVVKRAAQLIISGKLLAYPTDTIYGLGALVSKPAAVERVYKVRGRDFTKPMHVVVPSVAAAKKLVTWDTRAAKLAKQFWPGALTLVLPLKSRSGLLKKMTAGTMYLGLRMPDNEFVLKLAKRVAIPFTATGANALTPAGGYDSYTAEDVITQLSSTAHEPHAVVDAGRLKKTKPSTIVRLNTDGTLEVLRKGPISEKAIRSVLK